MPRLLKTTEVEIELDARSVKTSGKMKAGPKVLFFARRTQGPHTHAGNHDPFFQALGVDREMPDGDQWW